MSEKRTINIRIAEIPLSLNIDSVDEEIVRRAVREINERVLKYKEGHGEPELHYFLAFVALQHTIKMLQQDMKINEIEGISSRIDEYIKE